MQPDCVLMYITTANVEEARRIGQALVERRLAACANIIPAITSIFRWEGSIQTETEALLLVKTTKAALDEALTAARDLHSYSVPGISVLPISQGHPAFLQWIDAEVQS